jgi:hypothetical protein
MTTNVTEQGNNNSSITWNTTHSSLSNGRIAQDPRKRRKKKTNLTHFLVTDGYPRLRSLYLFLGASCIVFAIQSSKGKKTTSLLGGVGGTDPTNKGSRVNLDPCFATLRIADP